MSDVNNGPFIANGGPLPSPVSDEETVIVVSDLHMSEGVGAEIIGRPSWPVRAWQDIKRFWLGWESHRDIHKKNPLEDFPDDGPWVSFLDLLLAVYGQVPRLTLKLLGDTFDPHAVSWRGAMTDSPFESVGVRKMHKIIAGHPRFFDALASFIRRPNCRLDIFAGNHDLFLVWPRVRRIIIRRLAGRDREARQRIRFIDQEHSFRELDRGVLYYHGMDAETQNTVDPRTVILRPKFGWFKGQALLNEPYGSLMNVRVVNRIKSYNPLIGRLVNYRGLLRNAAVRRWGWLFYTAFRFIWHFALTLIKGTVVGRRVGLSGILRFVGETITNDAVDRYARRLLRRDGRFKTVILGHSHDWRRVTTPDGTYINTGTWTLMFELARSSIEYRWRRWRPVEWLWRSWLAFLHVGEDGFMTQVAKFVIWVAAALGAAFAYLVLEWPVTATVLLVTVVLSGVLRLFWPRPGVVTAQRFTFALVRHGPGGKLDVDLMEYLPASGSFRECV